MTQRQKFVDEDVNEEAQRAAERAERERQTRAPQISHDDFFGSNTGLSFFDSPDMREMEQQNQEAFNRAEQDGTFDRMHQQNLAAFNSPAMQEMQQRNQEAFNRAEQDGTFDRMHQQNLAAFNSPAMQEMQRRNNEAFNRASQPGGTFEQMRAKMKRGFGGSNW